MNQTIKIAVAGIMLAASGAAARAGVLSFQTYTTDAGTGISPSVTYTHVIDLNGGVTGQAATGINGVSFNVSGTGNNPALNYNLSTSNTFQNNNDGGTPAASGIHNLLLNFNYGTPTSLTLSGLQPNTTYRSRFFISTVFEGAGFNFTANDPGGATGDSSLPITSSETGFAGTVASNQAAATFLDRGSPNSTAAGEYIYQYTTGPAQNSITYAFTASDGANGFHSYGFSNEVVPEPAAVSVLAVGGMGLLARRRRA